MNLVSLSLCTCFVCKLKKYMLYYILSSYFILTTDICNLKEEYCKKNNMIVYLRGVVSSLLPWVLQISAITEIKSKTEVPLGECLKVNMLPVSAENVKYLRALEFS